MRELQKSKKNVLTLIGKNSFCDFLKFSSKHLLEAITIIKDFGTKIKLIKIIFNAIGGFLVRSPKNDEYYVVFMLYI